MLLTHQINIPIYNKNVVFIFGDPNEVKDYLLDTTGYSCKFDELTSNAVCIHLGLTAYIWFDLNTISVPILVHELSHAVFDLMDDVGLEKSDQEAFCYLIEYLLDQCKDIFAIQMEAISPQSLLEDDQVSS